MNRLLLTTLALLTGTFAFAQLGVRQTIPVKATLVDDRKINIELIGRNKGLVSFVETGKTSETDLKVDAFKWIDFGINLETNGVNALYQKEDYAAVATQLNKLLSPLIPYLDLPSDLPDQTMLLLKCLYRTGKYGDTVTLSNVMAVKLTDETMKRQAQLYKVLALIGRNERLEANLFLKSIGDIHHTNNAAGIYYYTRAQLYLTYTNWLGVQEFSSRVVAFAPRDEDWMAPALYLSAQAYAHHKQYAVAEQTLRELALVFSKTSWPAKAKPLQEEYKRLHEQQEAAKPPEALPGERGKSEVVDILKDNPDKGNKP
jgi:hypothetical protein